MVGKGVKECLALLQIWLAGSQGELLVSLLIGGNYGSRPPQNPIPIKLNCTLNATINRII